MNSTLSISVFYLGMVYLAAFTATCGQNLPVPFNYDQVISCTEFRASIWTLILQPIVLIVGYKLSPRFTRHSRKSVNTPAIKLTDNMRRFASFFILASATYFTVKILTTEPVLINSILRTLNGKESILLTLASSGAIFALATYNRLSVFLYALALYISFLFCWLDGSRTGLLPIAAVTLAKFGNRQIFGFVANVFVLGVLSALMFIARLNTDRSLDFLLNSFGSLGAQVENIYFLFSYLTAFSALHFLVVIDSGFTFSRSDLIYSILPIPASIIGSSIDPASWRLDPYRPFGAIAELYLFAPAASYAFLGFLGVIGKAVDSTSTPSVMRLLQLFFLTTLALSFQYHLRTVQWFVYLILILLMFTRHAPRS